MLTNAAEPDVNSALAADKHHAPITVYFALLPCGPFLGIVLN